MSAVLIPVPVSAWQRYAPARAAVLHRARYFGATNAVQQHALHILLDNLRTGASAACAIARANGSLRRALRATAGPQQGDSA